MQALQEKIASKFHSRTMRHTRRPRRALETPCMFGGVLQQPASGRAHESAHQAAPQAGWKRTTVSRKTVANFLVVTALLALYADSVAIVVRHDVDATEYRVPEPGPGYLVDLPHEGHAVLISDRWLVTVAHTIFYDYTGHKLSIAGDSYEIARVVVHPGYSDLTPRALESDSEALMRQLSARSDIALIELADPVDGAEPIALYRGDDERGLRVEIFGRGSTGTGVRGEVAATKAVRELRRCENIIAETSKHWLAYEFDPPESALPLEGMHGSGDSGGPAVAVVEGRPFLIGLSSWQYYEGDLDDFVGGLYGTLAFQVRISAYSRWIDSHIADRRE